MNRTVQKLLICLWLLVSFLLISVILKYYRESNEVAAVEEKRDQLVVMAVSEEDESGDYLKRLVDEYSKLPGNPEVRIQYVSQSGFQKQLCIDKDQNNLPDLIICENVMTPALESMGILRDLSDYMTAERASLYLKNAYSSTVVNGICYSIPFTSNPYVVFYNEDHLRKHNATIPDTMEELLKLCRETSTLGTYNFGFTMKNKEDIASSFLQMIYSAGGTLRSLDTENCMKLYEMLGNMRDEGIIDQDVINWNQKELMKAFSKGYVKIAIAELSSMSILENSDKKCKYKIAEIPYIQKQTYLLQGDNIGITVTADMEESIKLLDYLTSREVVKSYYENTYCLSVRTDVTVNPGLVRGLPDEFVERERNQSILKNAYTTWFIISDGIAGNLTAYLGDKTMTPEEVSKRLQGDIRSAILER
ncbi:ABC transporter substrate-binding protein [Lacrimispora sp.]|uniref:ABC transporter substrate-binding protein n=1 Tax=Lacrimispora sp. TaxID=2719234 RepID=UPI00286394C2|nr:extracellular solute-binding protein [Lacrimispora sp.]MDR7810773.1 extracellular solute-binding protein [Lacrimispora sp.]